jgi:hypothetical protein
LVFGELSAAQLKRASGLMRQNQGLCVQVVRPADKASAKEHVVDANGCLATATGQGAWALLRADGYLVANGLPLGTSIGNAVNKAYGYWK